MSNPGELFVFTCPDCGKPSYLRLHGDFIEDGCSPKVTAFASNEIARAAFLRWIEGLLNGTAATQNPCIRNEAVIAAVTDADIAGPPKAAPGESERNGDEPGA